MFVRNSTRIRAADSVRITTHKINATAAELEQYLIVFRLCRLRSATNRAISQINRRASFHDNHNPKPKP